jgi:hypothetical protein
MNDRIIESLERGEVKKAQEAATEFTRIQLREDSFAFKILPPEQATDDMLDRSLQDDKPRILWELEPDSPGAKWVPLQTIPEGEYIQGSRYVIPMARVVTPKYEKDIDELRTFRMDLRRVLTDNSIKDGLTEIDGKFIQIVDDIVEDTTGGVGTPHVLTGKIQWRTFAGGISRENVAESLKMLPSGSTTAGFENKFRLRNYVMLMNDLTAKEFVKHRRDEAGGDVSDEMYRNGVVLDTIMGVKVIYTIKGGLVPDNTIYYFAAPEFLGKIFYLTDWTLYMKKEAFFVEMFAYWLGGMAIGNVAGVARAEFTP